MSRWVGRWVGRTFIFLFCLFLKNYYIYITLITFGREKVLKYLLCKNQRKKLKIIFSKNFAQNGYISQKKVKGIPLFFDRFWWGKKTQGISFYFDTHAFIYPHFFFSCQFIFLNPRNSENRKVGKSENQKFGKSENLKFGKLENRKVGKSENSKIVMSENRRF